MRYTPKNLVMAAATLLATTSAASAWRSSLYPADWTPPGSGFDFTTEKFIQDFSYAGYKGGLVSLPTGGKIYNVRDSSDGVTNVADNTGVYDSTAAIQAHIDACENNGGGVVYLPTGTYKVKPVGNNTSSLRVRSNNVILRGAGIDNTKIVNAETNMRNKSVILFHPGQTPGDGASVDLKYDHMRPYTQIILNDSTGFAVGNWVELAWDFTPEWISANGQGTWWSAADSPVVARYVRQITAVNHASDTVTIDVPTRYAMKMRDNARIYKITGRLHGCGIEDLAIGNIATTLQGFGEEEYSDSAKAAYQCASSSLIKLSYTINCFVDNVKSFDPAGTGDSHMLSNGIQLSRAAKTTIRNVTMEKPQYGGGGANGYMFLIHGCENLVYQCKANRSRHGFALEHANTSGNVFYKCTDSWSGWAAGTTATGGYVTGGYGSDTHTNFTHSNLWDSCTVYESQWEAFHREELSGNAGATSAHGVFWNTEGGVKTSKAEGGHGGASDQSIITDQMKFGYVIGTKGATPGVLNKNNPYTAPIDHVEGVGTGATLVPQSLWLDQQAKRKLRE